MAVSAKAFKLQILQHEEMVKRAERQHQRSVPLTPGRAARSWTATATTWQCPWRCIPATARRVISRTQRQPRRLWRFLEVPRQEIVRKIRNSRNFVWLERRIPPERATKIRNPAARHRLSLPGDETFHSQFRSRRPCDRLHRHGSHSAWTGWSSSTIRSFWAIPARW